MVAIFAKRCYNLENTYFRRLVVARKRANRRSKTSSGLTSEIHPRFLYLKLEFCFDNAIMDIEKVLPL